MKIAILGSGAIGGYFGARLAAAGEDVAFIARGRQLAAMREGGLDLRSPRGDLRLDVLRATDDPASIGPVDVVLFTVKLWSTEEAASQLAPLMGRDTAVISLQNGVEANDVLARAVGREHLMGGVCYIAATLATYFVGKDADDEKAPVAGAKQVERLHDDLRKLREEIKFLTLQQR